MYECRLLKGADLAVDSTQIRADASPDRTITREQMPEVAKVNRTVREYVEQVERVNTVAEPAQAADPYASEAEKETRTAPYVSELATREDLDDLPCRLSHDRSAIAVSSLALRGTASHSCRHLVYRGTNSRTLLACSFQR